MNNIHRGRVEKGNLIFDNRNRYLVSLASLEGKRVELSIKKEKSQRSDNQNSYYWGVMIEILSSFTGYEREEMHEALKEKFLSSIPDEHGLRKIRSTAKLNTAEFTEYIDRIKRWSAIELNCYIPDPNEVI